MANLSFDIARLAAELDGECYSDTLHRSAYATDASIYQRIPAAIVYPKHDQDLVRTIAFASEYQVPILARGGGTSLAGQTVTEGIILDFTRYMHAALEYNAQQKWMRVQPGITRDEVNTIAAGDNLVFAPDPATSSRATIGGMIANNSSGTKSILYGKTIDHVLELKVLHTDGSVKVYGPMRPNGQIADVGLNGLREIVKTHHSAIRERFPKTMRRVSGYPLDELIHEQPWEPHKLFVGSEGTLGIILEAKINLVELPAVKAVGVVHFEKTIDAVKAVAPMLESKPAAIEILSGDLLDYSKKNLQTKSMSGWIEGHPESVQIVEFYGDTQEEIEFRAKGMFGKLIKGGLGYATDLYFQGDVYDHVWAIRKKGLGLLMGKPNERRGIAFIEDCAIPVEHLPEYIERVLGICDKYNIKATYYAHASVGVIHVRPIMDLRRQADIDAMKKISAEVFDLVVEYGGSWSGEHGDGRVRSPMLEEFFGPDVYRALREVKALFDPDKILNPGVIIDPAPMDTDLRYGAEYRDRTFDPVYRYPDQKNFHTAVHQCTGLGACRKIEDGTMCPSFMATREEVHSTRGRANALRLAMSGQLGDKALDHPVLMEAMDLCLSCKACKAECPSSVDMARLKSEVMQVHYDTKGVSLRDQLIRDSAMMAKRLAGGKARMVNIIQKTRLFRRAVASVAGLDRRRVLPSYAKESFSSWFKSNYSDKGYGRRVGLFADTYMQYHEPSIGRAAVDIIQALGYDIDLLEGCCQRPRISHGFLRLAAEEGTTLCTDIANYPGQVLVCEPGCASALTDDLPDLIDPDTGVETRNKSIPIELWLADHLENTPGKLCARSKEVFLHGHCHQKALYGTGAVHRIFQLLGAECYEPDSGCCGMGGSFGYEKEHYDISEKLANRVLVPALKERPNAMVLAAGFSCRHQIQHFAGRDAKHWLEGIGLMDNG